MKISDDVPKVFPPYPDGVLRRHILRSKELPSISSTGADFRLIRFAIFRLHPPARGRLRAKGVGGCPWTIDGAMVGGRGITPSPRAEALVRQ